MARNEWKYVADMETDYDAALPMVTCLPGEFNQAILILIVNAAHAIADVIGKGGPRRRAKSKYKPGNARTGMKSESRTRAGESPQTYEAESSIPFSPLRKSARAPGRDWPSPAQ